MEAAGIPGLRSAVGEGQERGESSAPPREEGLGLASLQGRPYILVTKSMTFGLMKRRLREAEDLATAIVHKFTASLREAHHCTLPTLLQGGVNTHSLPQGHIAYRNVTEAPSLCGISGLCKNAMQNVAEVMALQEAWRTREVWTVCTNLPRLEMLL